MSKAIFILFLGIMAFGCSKGQSYRRFGVDTTGGNIPEGLSLNVIAPDFISDNQDGKGIHLYNLLNDSKVVLFFYRGNWCPFCNTYLQNMRDSLDFILSRSAAVIAVSPESPQNVETTVEKYKPGFHVIHDSGNQIMEAYDVLFNVTGFYQTKIKAGKFTDIAKSNNQEQARLPVPATFVIDTNRRITYKHFNIDFRERASVSDIIKYLQ
jgi:peroxiredoxin